MYVEVSEAGRAVWFSSVYAAAAAWELNTAASCADQMYETGRRGED